MELVTHARRFGGTDVGASPEIASPAHRTRRLRPEEIQRLIVELCQGRFLTAAHLSELMNRSAAGLRDRFLKPMVEAGVLHLRYPNKPNRPDQAYTAVERTRQKS